MSFERPGAAPVSVLVSADVDTFLAADRSGADIIRDDFVNGIGYVAEMGLLALKELDTPDREYSTHILD